MKAQRRVLPATTGTAPKNTVTTRKDAPTQAQGIRNTVSKPKAVGYSKVRGAVSG